ncbi:MAG: transporter [Burkholderiales bacterium]|nr:transporter [Burkholderiales bacterium]
MFCLRRFILNFTSFKSPACLRLIAFLLLNSAAFGVNAFQPLMTDDTGTPEKGSNQLEFVASQDWAKTAGEAAHLLKIPLVYTRGLTDTLEIHVGTQYARVRPNITGNDRGMGNPSIGAKWRFYENEKNGTSIALKSEISFPVSASREKAGLGVGKTSGNLTFILTQEVSFGEIHFNAAIGRDRFRDAGIAPDATLGRISVAPVWKVTDKWQLALDAGIESKKGGGTTEYSRYVEPAVIFVPNKDLDLGLGFIAATNNQSPRTTTYTLIGSVTWQF